MDAHSNFWTLLRRNLLVPKVDEQQLEQCLDRVREHLPVPVFWLLGKAQSGKTSLIRALTGSSSAEIGNGFRACTRTARLYAFPSDEECFVRFLDTRGLGEVAYDPHEDLTVFENQAHLLVVVVRALDHAQQCVLEPLEKIRQRHPRWPLIVVQTCLHEAYPPGTLQHPLPYPFGRMPFPPAVPVDLARSLAAQRALFNKFDAIFVPVDFTLPEDGFHVPLYGLEELWEAIEHVLPLGLRGMLEETQAARERLRDLYFRTAHPHVIWYSMAAGAAAAVPAPLIDVPAVLAIQAKMFHAVASVYEQPMNRQRMADIAGALGIGFAVRLGGRELLKVIPGFGSAVSALYAAATTYALGCTLCTYFSRVRRGDVPEPAALRKLYAAEYEEGRRRFRDYFQQFIANGDVRPEPPAPSPQSGSN